MPEKWSGASDGKSCVSNWCDGQGAHIGLYGTMGGKACDIAITVTPQRDIILQVVTGDVIEHYDVRKLLAAINSVVPDTGLTSFRLAGVTPKVDPTLA